MGTIPQNPTPHFRLTDKTIIGLKQHWPVHTGEKPYTRKTCGKSFGFLSNLYDHVSVHSENALKWQCPFCVKRCRLKGNMFKHFRTHFADIQQRQQEWKKSFPAIRFVYSRCSPLMLPLGVVEANFLGPQICGSDRIPRILLAVGSGFERLLAKLKLSGSAQL